jgi:hypothetical protein
VLKKDDTVEGGLPLLDITGHGNPVGAAGGGGGGHKGVAERRGRGGLACAKPQHQTGPTEMLRMLMAGSPLTRYHVSVGSSYSRQSSRQGSPHSAGRGERRGSSHERTPVAQPSLKSPGPTPSSPERSIGTHGL